MNDFFPFAENADGLLSPAKIWNLNTNDSTSIKAQMAMCILIKFDFNFPLLGSVKEKKSTYV